MTGRLTHDSLMPNVISVIAGPGAIGALVCAQMQACGQVSVYQHREDLQLATQLEVTEKQYRLNWTLVKDFNIAPDIVWVTCKAFNVIATTETLVHAFPNAQFIILNNGMGPQQELKTRYPERICVGSTTCGALKINDQQYKQTSFGETLIESAAGSVLKNLKNTQAPPMNIRATTDINPVLWRKLMINTCINPVTASLQIQNGELLNPSFKEELALLIDEVNNLATAAGQRTIENGLETVLKVAENSQHNWSSMAMDVKQGRKTEIDFINGYLLELANAHGIKTPRIEYWYDRIASIHIS